MTATSPTPIPDQTTSIPSPARLATLAMSGIRRPWPNQPAHVLTAAEERISPRDLHPAFFGCYDWHSAVHAHWTLVRLLRLHREDVPGAALTETLDETLTVANLEAETDYFLRPEAAGFERMYGWAWLLALEAELGLLDDAPAGRWRAAVTPLAELLMERTVSYLDRLTRPIRAGTHANTAFALGLMLDAADVMGRYAFRDRLIRRVLADFRSDTDWPLRYEPSGEDFLSPGLCEADCLRRVLPPELFGQWLSTFLPCWDGASDLGLTPVLVEDLSDGRLVHLVGLNLSRAWMLDDIGEALGPSDPRYDAIAGSAAAHLEAGLSRVCTGQYAGEHWLGTFAVRAAYSSR